ncbi:MAG: ABC transporter permease subunit, partial [Clostridia bacterium]
MPFAYILIGGILRNMDANLEEAATILKASRGKIMRRITLPIVMPALISTILLVFSSAMGSYPVPHYLKFDTLATKYVEMNVFRQGERSIIAVLMMIIGVIILVINQYSTSGRKNYTTVTGKSGQVSLINL